jgi:murein DD-endopeptidase MepM/ murein hydrolase activator NlpD
MMALLLAAGAPWWGGGVARAEAVSCQSAELADARAALAERDRTVALLSERLRRIANGNIRAVERALNGTGIDVGRLAGRRGTRPSGGQGGPLIAEGSALAAAMDDVERWDNLRRAVGVLPWGAPLASYRLTSGFGRRPDPFTHRLAIHPGVDLQSRLRAPVLATGPGRVVFAGWRRGYGRLVEIDHGLGVRSRYGHLAAIRARVGQRVRGGQTVGLLGSSGRSTGPHLHYEVVAAGVPRDPTLFIHRFY